MACGSAVSAVPSGDVARSDKTRSSTGERAAVTRKPRRQLPSLPPVLMGKLVGRAQLAQAAVDKSLPTEAELDTAWARVFLRSNPGPFQYVAYEITARGNAGVISHTRGTMGRKDPIMRTELIDRPKLRQIMGRLRALDAASLVDPGPLVSPANSAPKPARKSPRRRSKKRDAKGDDGDDHDDTRWPDRSAVPVYELSFRLAGKTRTVVVADPYRSADPRYARFINAVRDEVIATVGDVGWHSGTSEDAKAGYLFIDSVPSADVWVDGVKLPEKTPVFAYAAAAGKHTVVLENEAQGLKKTFKVKVRRGATTSLEVDLR